MQMRNLVKAASQPDGLKETEIKDIIKASLPKQVNLINKVLLIPPDGTRAYSYAGMITNTYYHLLKDTCEVFILPALGTHVAMTEEECSDMFGDIPYNRFIEHNWRTDVVKLCEVSKAVVSEISDYLFNDSVAVEINKHLLDKTYDAIISIGQVIPHEVVGMANYTKNILVGCGGSNIINASHIIGAFYGLERLMGKDFSPVRKLFDYIETEHLKDLPITYVLTVTTVEDKQPRLHGIFIGRDRKQFEQAVTLSQRKNLIFVKKPLRKVVTYLDPQEFKSTWIGNKAIYRTRMAIADGGELVILAPGIERFGEDLEIDKLIRKYGYTSREKVLLLCENNEDIKANMSAAAHLIQGSSEGRFNITYCPRLMTEKEIAGVGYSYMPFDEAISKYNPNILKEGYNTMPDGEEVFYISNPALGLWADKAKF